MFESAAMVQAAVTPTDTSAQLPAVQSSEVTLFGESMAQAQANQSASLESFKAAVEPLDYINNEASEIVSYAKEAVASGNELTPSEIVMLTARSHEFMFHCQLTSNVANRTSDGIQQLFRQQN